MTIISPHRLVPVALALLVGLVVAASPAAATDDPAPRPTPQGGAQQQGGGGAAPAGAQAPSSQAPSSQAPSASHRKRASKRVRVRVRHRKHRRGVRISLSGPGLKGVTRVDVLANGRRIGRDRSRPFRLVINGRRLGKTRTVQIRLVSAGSVRTLTRRLRRSGAAHTSAFESLDVAMALDALLGRFELS
jgi:hypothetical protein